MGHPVELMDVNIPLGFVLLGFVLLACVNVLLSLRSRGDRGMSTDEDKKRLAREQKRIAVCDAFETALLDLWANNVITRDDHNYYCKVLGEQFHFTDLLRRANAHSLHPNHLKRKLEVLKRTIVNKRSNGKATESPPITSPEVVSLSERLRLIAGK